MKMAQNKEIKIDFVAMVQKQIKRMSDFDCMSDCILRGNLVEMTRNIYKTHINVHLNCF